MRLGSDPSLRSTFRFCRDFNKLSKIYKIKEATGRDTSNLNACFNTIGPLLLKTGFVVNEKQYL